jgi:hypothetical protein
MQPADVHTSPCLLPCRHIRLLKELVQQLGPIGAAVQARLGEAADEQQRALLQAQKDLALGMYEQLSSYLAYEDDVQVGAIRPARRILCFRCYLRCSVVCAPRNGVSTGQTHSPWI